MNRKKIKILNILTNINDGGLEILVYRILKGLDKSRFELDVCTLTKSVDGFLTREFKNVTDNFLELEFKNKNAGLKGALVNLINLLRLAKIIRKGNYDIVHSHDIFSPMFTRTAIIINRFIFFICKYRLINN